MLFADVSGTEQAVRSSIESLRWLFAVVLALAIGEAFKQFVSDKAEKPEDSHIHWNRIWALVAFVLLVVPFSHGMARYFFETYQEAARPKPYARFLLVDTAVFTVEAILFFVLSRALPQTQWRRFYNTVIILLILDILWGSFTASTHAPRMWTWVIVNLCTVPLLAYFLHYYRARDSTTGMIACMAIIVCRTIADYALSFSFYFPPQP